MAIHRALASNPWMRMKSACDENEEKNTMNLKLKLYRFFSLFGLVVMFVAGFGKNTFAVNMTAGDLVFIIFGNDTEFIQNLGPASTLLAPGTTTTFLVSPSALSAVAGANPTKWALVGYNQTGGQIILL